MTNEQIELLKKPFKSNEVKWRISKTSDKSGKLRGMAVAYLDSRAIQDRLDAVVGGGNWQCKFDAHALGGNNAFICTISIFFAEHNEWIGKSNGAGSTKIEPVKGGLSDALKRAASTWGMGRYLYEFEGVWVDLDQWKNITEGELKRLDGIYVANVKRLFPKPAANANPQANQGNQHNPPAPTQNQPPPQAAQSANESAPPIIEVPRRFTQNPIYTVVNASCNNGYSIIELKDGKNPPFSVYFEGVAAVARNQFITDVAIQKKTGSMGEYNILKTFRIAENVADSTSCSQAA